MTDIQVGDWVTVTYTASTHTGKQVVFDGQVVEMRGPGEIPGYPMRTIRVESLLPAYGTKWWHRHQVESYRTALTPTSHSTSH